jgi:hypothetical protein
MAGVLEASFVRVAGQRDRIYVHRSNGAEVSWVFATYGAELPHDLVHLVVEAAFGLRHGFWGRVDAGVDPGRINDEANRTGGADKYRGFGPDRREILLAEGLAAAPWLDPSRSDAERREAILQSYAGAGIEPPAEEALDRIAEVGEALERLRARWRALGAKGTLRLRFLPEDPRRGFDELLAEAE